MARPRKEPDVFLLQDDLFETNKADAVDPLKIEELDRTTLLDCASELAIRQIQLALSDSVSIEPRDRASVSAFVFHEHELLEYYCLSLLVHMRRSGASIPVSDDVSFLGFAAGVGCEEPEFIVMKGIVKCVAKNLCETAEKIVDDPGLNDDATFKNWLDGKGPGLTGMPYLYDDVKALAEGRLPYDYFASNQEKRTLQ